jgi:hypothetical protein
MIDSLPLGPSFWSAALYLVLQKLIKQVQEITSRAGISSSFALKILVPYLTTFPAPQNLIVTISWNGLCHPAAALLGSSPDPPLSLFLPLGILYLVYASLAVYLGVRSRRPL